MGELILLIPVLLLTLASVIDLRTREIPDWISVALIAVGVTAAAQGWADIQWWMVVTGTFIGFAVGFGLFRFASFGGGDAKLITGVGAILGPVGLWFFLMWMALAGGALALAAKYRGKGQCAYGPAILIGYMGFLIFPADMWTTLRNLMQ